LLDISMPLLNGIEAAQRIRQEAPETKVTILTMHTDRHYVRAALHAGVSGYVLKHAASEYLLESMERVLEGGVYITPELVLAASTGESAVTLNEYLFGRKLTPRQRDVLQLVAEGKSAKDIGHLLNISVKTVEFHKASIFSSLGLRTTAELTRYAVRQGIVTS
jgi:DNA-binding NarL/FixJ family response regulator